MRWRETIDRASNLLREAGINDAELNAELLAVHLKGGWKRSDISPYLREELTASEESDYEQLITRRLAHEPLQYIIGETEFYGLRLFCNPSVLIPRPDTEVLVETVLEEAALLDSDHIRILDIGTGSGAIILALASRLPNAVCVGVDSSEDALALAEENRNRHGISNVEFVKADIFDDVDIGTFDIVVSNPPYISAAEMPLLEKEVLDYEPRLALTDEADGLTFYKEIVQKASGSLLKECGLLIVEIGYDASCHVGAILKNGGFEKICLNHDLSGVGRVIRGNKKQII